MPSQTPEGHFQYPDLHELRWYRNGENIEVDGNVAEQTHDGIVDWLEQLEIRLTGVVENVGDLPSPDEDRVDPRTGAERIYLVRNRDRFYRDTGDDWEVTGASEGDAVGAGAGLVLNDQYEVDLGGDFDWTGVHEFDNNNVAFRVGNQGSSPIQPGDVTRDDNDVLVHSGNGVVNLSNVGGGSGGGGSDVISSPNMNISYTEINDGQRIGNPVSVGDGQELEVRSWGVSDTDGNTPSGLTVQLLDENNNVLGSANTEWDTDVNGVAGYDNTSGSRQTVLLAINNDTGSDYTDPDGVGAQFGFVVS